jgi:hypothetical protein
MGDFGLIHIQDSRRYNGMILMQIHFCHEE